MFVVTVNCKVGSGASEVGSELARILEIDYVDRLILAEAAKRVGATVSALIEKEQRPVTLGDRIARALQNILERSAWTGAGADPFFGPGADSLMSKYYPEGAREEPIARAQELDDLHFFEVISQVIGDLSREGSFVVVGRGSNVILKDMPNAFHVGLVSEWPSRLRTIQNREHLDEKAAERFIITTEKARENYYRRFLKVEADNPSRYHIVLNTGLMGFSLAAQMAAQSARAYLEQRSKESER